MESALICDKKLFSHIYELEKRRSDRDWHSTFISQITINSEISSEKRLEEAGQHLMDILKTKMRSGDVICRLEDEQYAIILYNIDSNDAATVMNRIFYYSDSGKNIDYELEIDYRKLA